MCDLLLALFLRFLAIKWGSHTYRDVFCFLFVKIENNAGMGKGYQWSMNINQNTATLGKVLCECLWNINIKYVLVLNIIHPLQVQIISVTRVPAFTYTDEKIRTLWSLSFKTVINVIFKTNCVYLKIEEVWVVMKKAV